MYDFVKTSFTRSYLLPLKDGYLLIDTSYENKYTEFVKKLTNKGIKISDIKYLFLTHHHDDHSGFAEALRKANKNIALITHEKSLATLVSGKHDMDSYPLNKCVGFLVFVFNSLFKEKKDWSFPPVEIHDSDYIVRGDDYDLLPSIGVDGIILHTTGHSPDSISIVLADGSAFVGDLAMDFLSFCGCNYRPIYVTNLMEVYQSWKKIIQHGAKTIYSSHAKKPFSAIGLNKAMTKFGVS